MHNAFASINSNTAFAQNDPAPDETATAGYTLLNLSIGADIKIANQFLSFMISATNLFDTKHIDHLSTLKEVISFDPGRNFSLPLKVPFGILLLRSFFRN